MDRIIEMSREIYNIESPAGVYIIEGIFEERYYIGSSKNIRKRIIQHETMLKAGGHENKELQDAYNKGVMFWAEPLRLMLSPTHQDLLEEEWREINKAKRLGVNLYNILEMRGPSYYTSENAIKEYLANLYIKEHYGKSFNNYFSNTPAKREMLFRIIQDPSREKEITEEYSPAIHAQTKRYYYRSRGIDYDQCVFEAELQGITIKEAFNRQLRYNDIEKRPPYIKNYSD